MVLLYWKRNDTRQPDALAGADLRASFKLDLQYVRKSSGQGIALDDWLILVRLLLTLLAGVLLLWGNAIDPDGGKIIDAAPADFDTTGHELFIKLSFLSSILYFSIVSVIKISVLFLYRRIFSIEREFRIQSRLVIILVGIFWLATTVTTLANCVPFQYSWIGLSLKEHCINHNVFWMATGAVEVVLDTAILTLPIRMVLRLQLSSKRKAFVVFIFLLGAFVVITGLLRVIYAYVLGRRVPSYTKAELWSAVHIGMAIVCACLPTLRRLVIRKPVTDTPRRYFGFRSWQSKGVSIQNSDQSKGAVIEIIPLRHQESMEDSIANTVSTRLHVTE
ncbi:MAG: hypothetical protein MMC23_005421 [Stictis urceolatum]|nr:hypothetical protein [Stictis urceolata]